MFLTSMDTAPGAGDGRWAYVGDPRWRLDADGSLYPPVFASERFDQGPDRVPDLYAHPLAREDYAILADTPLEDTDIAFDYACPYGSVLHGGVVFRARGAHAYVMDIFEMSRKAQAYEVVLWLQDDSGYRRELARAQVPHSIIPERINQRGTPTRFLWDHSAPEFMRFRVQASGSVIRISADGQILMEFRDEHAASGCAGFVARGAVTFRHVEIHGYPAEDAAPWQAPRSTEIPAFFYPGDPQPEGFNAYPVVCRMPDGGLLSAWTHDPDPAWYGGGSGVPCVLLTRSDDGGATWTAPAPVRREAPCYTCGASSLFAHLDGSLTLLSHIADTAESPPRFRRLRSTDGGASWGEPEPFLVAGRPLHDRPYTHPYSPMQRLSDGTVVMTAYEADSSRGEANDVRRDRALFLRSDDDGHTWDEEPAFIDADNVDHNECMVAEPAPGQLVAFMRTLRAPFMWTSRSEDGGRTWAPLTQTDVSAECPCLLAHSSGALVLGSRGLGLFLRISRDGGHTWGPVWRVSPMSAMMGMTELPDGRIFLVGHEGYRVPGHIRGQVIEITAEGPRAGTIQGEHT